MSQTPLKEKTHQLQPDVGGQQLVLLILKQKNSEKQSELVFL